MFERASLRYFCTKPKVLQKTTDLVLDVAALADQQGPAREQGRVAMGRQLLDLHFAVPAHAHQLRQTRRIVAVGLVHSSNFVAACAAVLAMT